ncbi:MAG: UbiD family decarboxylase [Acidobacteria bacterium]|nr:UbiD family decarboxylase [Acidobacteriota bacterium]
MEGKGLQMDLRAFMDELQAETPADFVRIRKPVHPRFELTAVVAKLEQQRRRPLLYFERVEGTSFPVVCNLTASRTRLARAMRTTPAGLVQRYLQVLHEGVEPHRVDTGPVKQVILRDEQVNLLDLPQIVHHQEDAGPYVTAGIAIARDPDTGLNNASFNRMMIKGRNKGSLHLTTGKHLWEFYRRAESRNQPLEVALVIGVHPAVELGAVHTGSIQEDELKIMGSLLGKPLEVVRCETLDLWVPAHAEIVLEGVLLPHVREEEGPFGEFTGYALGTRPREIFQVQAIIHRRDAVFRDIAVGHADHLLLSSIPMEANLFRAVQAMIPSVTAVRIPAPFTAYISIQKRAVGQGVNAILAALGAELYLKWVVVVDHDIDVFDDRQVRWALATRVQPDRDVVILPNARGSDLDPSTLEDGVTSKIGIDATAHPSLEQFTPRHRVPPDLLDKIKLEDYL